uniref:leucine-rich repeat extensin-like protein 5 isoform X2 n=1 Tax=Scatophagus argus TaxID=75038 RepID=UPI001ED7D6EA|nr:leucine-rich repeat extensin-like protein 5 isoform X2 [Scatophagus argus]
MEDPDQRSTWTSVLVPNPNRPGSPRLILRRIPAPGPSSSSSPSSTSRSTPPTPCGYLCCSCSSCSCSTFCSGCSLRFPSPSPASPPSRPQDDQSKVALRKLLVPDQRSTWTSVLVPNPNRPGSPRLILRRIPAPGPSSSSSPSSTPRSPSPSPASPPSRPQDDQSKVALRKLPVVSSPDRPEVPSKVSTCLSSQNPTKPRPMTAGPRPKWVRNMQAIIRERNRQRGIRGGKRTAGRPKGEPAAKRSFNS